MIIGLAGAKRAGKNTVAKIIAEEFSDVYEVKEWSFAEDLKRSAAASLGANSDPEYAVLFCDKLKENHRIEIWAEEENADLLVWQLTGREFLQKYGTEAHRDIFGDQFWVDNLLDKINPNYNWSSRLDVITDLRFDNESEAVKKYSGKVIRVRRPEVESSGDTHASEKPLPDDLVDIELWNDREINETRKRITKIIEVWLGG